MNINNIKTLYNHVWKAPHQTGLYVRLKDQVGLVSIKGDVLIPPKYDELTHLGYDLFSYMLNNKIGIINMKGVRKTKAIYDNMYPFQEKLAIVEIDKKYGYVDLNGKLVCPLIYDSIQPFKNGFSRVRKYHLWSYINENFEEIIPFIYEETRDFMHGYAAVNEKFFDDTHWGIIDTTGKEVVPLKYQFVDLDEPLKLYNRKLKIESIL